MSVPRTDDAIRRFRAAAEDLSEAVERLMDGFLDGCPERDSPIPMSQCDEATDLRSLARDVATRLERSDRHREAGDLDGELNQLVRCSELLHQIRRGCLDLSIRIRRYAHLRPRGDLGAERWSGRVLGELDQVAATVRSADDACDECIVALSLGDAAAPRVADGARAAPSRGAPGEPDTTHALESLAEAVRAVALRLGDVHSCLRESRLASARPEFPAPSKR